nr:arylamine N-acetyltransferase / N-hydroxyarylamine O-acetyltransferase-like [Dermacentor andersoni]XP_054922410.1 arylamine N-acetyltransferase / N-hydroxyarylamine O-acetyltransferase-like [Dermacentor andersoni]XP_054922411.1 arylamine N-acetyltransferase / N-hydroxyarylamine O-acetyltransferase-like [Dermacentor andersoni]XP_054922412.1 arylamine N-acetyltransferase / N-hydroxyarylamine O-acetyltransferase-like [Dermacentor andersoni]XP_054922413.1 arylamine N-acetyltransferase / N-hydrox
MTQCLDTRAGTSLSPQSQRRIPERQTPTMEPLSDERAQSYLRHLGVSKPSEPTLDFLDRLIRAHLERATFENLDELLERRVSLDPEAILGKVTGRGRGGYCYELNSLFARLLLALGYSVRLRAARLRLTTPDDSDKRTRLSHMVLLVELTDGRRYIVDVGMAQCGLHRALPLEGDATPFRLRSLDATEAVEVAVPTSDGGWKAFYVVEPYDLDWLDFGVLNWYSSTHPDSAMRRLLLVGRRSPRDDGSWLRLINDRFVRWSPIQGVVEKRVMRDENDILEILRDEFGLNLNTADDVAPLRVCLRGLLENLRLGQNLFLKKPLWPEG